MAKDRVKNATMVITRRFDAPLELVFNAFTDPEHLARWWEPKGFRMLYCKLDLRSGGMFHYCTLSPEGDLLWGRFIYREIIPLQKIIFINSFSGSLVETMHKVFFSEEPGITVVKFSGEAVNAAGYNYMFDQLENHLSHIASLQKINYGKKSAGHQRSRIGAVAPIRRAS
jgi:uncharacterized protein YndB with AHSA1/START domain